MATSPKSPSQLARKDSTTVQSQNRPDRQFDPNRTVERKGQYIMERLQEAGAIRRTS